MNYQSNSGRALFSSEYDDVEDETFLHHPSSGSSGYILNNSRPPEVLSLEERRQQILDRKREIEERTVLSTENSLSYLKSSEEVGIAAAEELLRQREQLQRTERHLDNINTTLRFSQKHIQGIKSVFGGLKKIFGGNTSLPPGGLSQEFEPRRTQLNEALDSIKQPSSSKSPSNEDHPALRLRRDDKFGYSETGNPKLNSHQKRIDQNLDEMLSSISRLKGLAHGLGEEIETHNAILDNVLDATEQADDTLKRQTKSINHLLH